MKNPKDDPQRHRRRAITVALTRDEVASFRMMADRAKLSLSDFIRRCVAIAGQRVSGLEFEPQEYRGPREAVSEENNSEWELI